jgi:hypothetical protein
MDALIDMIIIRMKGRIDPTRVDQMDRSIDHRYPHFSTTTTLKNKHNTMHNATQVLAGREEEVAVGELQEVHWRVLGATPRGFRQPLPQVDVFAPPRVREIGEKEEERRGLLGRVWGLFGLIGWG